MYMVVLFLATVISSVDEDPFDTFIHIFQDCFTITEVKSAGA